MKKRNGGSTWNSSAGSFYAASCLNRTKPNYLTFRQKHLREASLPPFNTLNETYGLELNIMGEIISAHDFDQGDIQLFWSLEPGEEWNILSSTDTDGKPSPLYSFAIDDEHVSSGYTQSSTAVWSDENEVFESYFGMPLEFHLGCTEYDISTRGPKIYFEVRSVDSWGRGKVCGYGWTYLPSAPGKSLNQQTDFVTPF